MFSSLNLSAMEKQLLNPHAGFPVLDSSDVCVCVCVFIHVCCVCMFLYIHVHYTLLCVSGGHGMRALGGG